MNLFYNLDFIYRLDSAGQDGRNSLLTCIVFFGNNGQLIFMLKKKYFLIDRFISITHVRHVFLYYEFMNLTYVRCQKGV